MEDVGDVEDYDLLHVEINSRKAKRDHPNAVEEKVDSSIRRKRSGWGRFVYTAECSPPGQL